MSRRTSSKEASEAVGAYLQRTRDSRSSLESPNSSLSPWYISDRYGVSLSTMTIRSPYQPHSVSGSMSGINYMTSVSSSIIPRTRTRLITASTSGGGQVIHGGGADSVPYACRPLRVGTDTAITGSNEPFPSYVRVIPSHGHLVQSHSSSCSCGHAFVRHTTRVSVRVGSMTSSPVIADRMRQASFGRRTTRRASFVTAKLSVSTGQAAQTTSTSCATLADFKQLDVTPGALTSAQTDAAGQLGVTPTASTSSHDDVGRALFSDWAHRKQEMFADIFKDRNDFFADLLRKRVDEEHQPIAPAQVTLSADSSHSGPFMTTISEAGEKDGPDTSAENYTVHSATTASSTTEKTAVEEKTPLQALTASTRLTSSEFYSYEFSKTQVTETPNDGVTKEIPQHKAASLDGKLQYKSFDFQPKEVVMAPDAPDAETVKGTSVDLSTTETKSGEKKGRLGETLPLEQFHSTKAMPVSSAESLEAASTRTQVPTEARGHSYVPALAESSFETPGATSEEHHLLPTSLEGPFMSMASDMTDFPALDLSKMQEPDVSTQSSSLQKPDNGEVQTQLAERPQTDQRAQIQATGSLLKLGASRVSCPILEDQTPRPQHTTEAIGQKEIGEHTKECESREVISMPPYRRSELALSEQTTTFDKGALEKQSDHNLKDVAQEHPSQGRPREESDARDFVPKEVDLSNEMAASVGSVTVSDAATAEKNKNLPLASDTQEPTNQEYPAKEEHDKRASKILAGLPELDSELISSEHAPLSDASMTLHTDDILTSTQIGESSTDDNVGMRQTPKESGEIIPRREERSSEQGLPEESAVDDEKSTEKRGSIPFTEPAVGPRPMMERYVDKKEHDKQTSDVLIGHPEQDSEQFFSKQAPLPDVSMAQHTPDILPSTQTGESGADEQVPKRDRAKESGIEEIVAGHEERSSQPELPDSSAVFEALPTEKHGGIPFTEAAVETGKEHYVGKQEHDKQTSDILVGHPEQDSKLISSKQAPLPDVSMAQHTTDILPSAQTCESGADEDVSKREIARESRIGEIIPKHEEQSSQPELPKSSAVVETQPPEKHDGIPFTKPAVELMNEHYVAELVFDKKTSDIFVGPQQQDSEQISSEHAAVPGVSITRDTTGIVASTQVGASAADENVSTRQAAEASKSKDIVPGQEYEGSEPASTKGHAILETKATARETGISFTEPSTEPTDDVIIRKQKPDKKIQRKMSSNLQQVGELFSTEPTLLSDVDLSATQQPYDSLIRQSASAASYENTSQHETAKISNLRDFMPRQDQEGEPASSESFAALELKATAKHEGIPFADLPTEPTDDDFIRRQRPEKGIQRDVSSSSYLQKGGELVSTEPTPLSEADLSTTQPTDDWLLHQSSAAAPDESTLLHETAKVRHLQDIVPRQKDQSSKPASLESSAEFEMKATAEQNVPLAELSTEPTDDGFMKKQKPEKESQRKVSSELRQGGELVSTAPTLFSDSEFGTAVKSDDSLLSQHAASAPDESTMPHATEKISSLRDVVPRQEDKGNEPASSESSAALELKAIAKHERIPFVELSTKPTDDDFMKKPKPEKESQPAVTSYPQGGVSLVSTKPTPPSATGVRTTQPPDDSLLPHSSAYASDESITMLVVVNLSDLKDAGPGKEDHKSERAPSEISRVVERSATEKHEALLKHALSTSLEYAQHPDHKEENVEDRAENVKTGVLPAGQSTALGLQVGPLGVKRTSKEKTSTGREVIQCATVANELTWSASLERPTENPEGEPEPTEDATLATKPDIQQPKKDEIERTVSDLVVGTFDKERGPLLSVTKTEKHSCEITSERTLKRYGDTKPMESVTGARESFVIKGTESQFFDASMRKSIMRNAPEIARAEVEYNHWKFEPDVFLDDLMGKSAIEPTEPSQPCDFIARPFDIFDDVVAVAAISATEAVSWKHSLSEDAVIPVESRLTKESVPYCHEIEIEDNDNAFYNTNGVDKTPEKASSKFDSDPICPPNASLVATFSLLPEAEFGSLTNQNQCYTPPFHTEDVQALSDKQAKLHSANISLEKNCAPFETATPPVRKPPLETPAAEPPTTENKDDGLQRPLYVEAAFEDAKRQVHKPLLSLGTGRTDYSDEHITSTCDDETAPVDRLENAKGAANSTLESSIREFETSVLAGAASSGSLRKGGLPTTEQKTWLSSVSVGYTQEPRASDNTSSSGGDGSDDFERLKVRLFERTLSEGPGDIADEDLRKSELASSLSPSHVVCTDTPFTREHAWSFDSEVGYAPATVLRDDVYRMSLPSSAAAEGPANEGSKIGVPASDKETTKSVNTLTPACESTLIAKEYARRHSEEPQNENYDAIATSVPLERSRSERSESPAKHNGEKRMEPLSKPAGADSEDDGRDISGQSPDADDENHEAVSRYKELRFENFRRIVKCMADLSSRSEVDIVYESFVTPVGKVCDMLGSVHYDTAFKVCVVDDYDLASIMHDRWNEDAASVAPTIKTFWSYSPHSFLMSVDENGTQCGIISAIVFEDEQAFCAANSVKREFLAEGAKRQLWDALLSVEHGKNLFTVVPANEVGAYYRHLGFYTSARGLILHGRLASDTELAPLGQVPLPDGVEIVKFKKQMYSSLLSFDKSTLGFGRKRFWRMTLREGPISFRVALQGGSVCGYAGLQNDVNGVPVVRWVVAADGRVAMRLLHNLLAGSFTFRQRGAWMALYARSHASAALLRHLDTSGFEPWMLLFNRREPFLQYKNIAVLTYI
nr:microtubule-associated protein futsch-like [Rhipicephalus microplus]